MPVHIRSVFVPAMTENDQAVPQNPHRTTLILNTDYRWDQPNHGLMMYQPPWAAPFPATRFFILWGHDDRIVGGISAASPPFLRFIGEMAIGPYGCHNHSAVDDAYLFYIEEITIPEGAKHEPEAPEERKPTERELIKWGPFIIG